MYRDDEDKAEQTDGWVTPEASTDERTEATFDPSSFHRAPDHLPVRADRDAPPAPTPPNANTDASPSAGKSMAVLGHLSVLFGLPVFLLPLLQNDDDFSRRHGRAAALIYLGFYGSIGLSFLNCGVFMPLAMLFYIPAVVAIGRAVEGRPPGKWGFGELADRIFESP